MTQTVTDVSRHLGNTPAVCRRSYVHPVVIDEFRAGTLAESWTAPVARLAGHDLAERRLLALLEGTAHSRRGRATSVKAA